MIIIEGDSKEPFALVDKYTYSGWRGYYHTEKYEAYFDDGDAVRLFNTVREIKAWQSGGPAAGVVPMSYLTSLALGV